MSSKVENTIDKEKEYELSKIKDLLEDSIERLYVHPLFNATNEQISKNLDRIMERQKITTFCIHFSLVDNVMWAHHAGRQDVAIRTWPRRTWMPGNDRQGGPGLYGIPVRMWPSGYGRQDVTGRM